MKTSQVILSGLGLALAAGEAGAFSISPAASVVRSGNLKLAASSALANKGLPLRSSAKNGRAASLRLNMSGGAATANTIGAKLTPATAGKKSHSGCLSAVQLLDRGAQIVQRGGERATTEEGSAFSNENKLLWLIGAKRGHNHGAR